MGTIWIKELTGGLDVRRLSETTPGGVLVRADNGHITRGGEFQSRAAFVPEMQLPQGTVGLAHTRTGLVVFGSAPQPAAMPNGVRYQRLQKGGRTLGRIRDWELFEGKIYAVAEFADGTVAHFYDGVEVPAWQEARAAATLRVTSGEIIPEAHATAEITVVGGTAAPVNEITSLKVAGTELLAERVVHTGNNATTAQAVAAEINAKPTKPKYNAATIGARIILTADKGGPSANGRTLVWEATGNFHLDNETVFSGGAAAVIPFVRDIKVDGVSIIRRPVEWAGSTVATASAIADAIMETASEPEYEAEAKGNAVTIKTTEAGTEANGRVLTVSTTGSIEVVAGGNSTFTGGATLGSGRYLPADVVLTVREKLYAGAGSILHMSAVQNPTHWTPGGTATDQIGAGFKNIAASNSTSYRITGLARYFERIAVFTPDTVQTWFLDPDPDLVVQTQVLENTGTECPHSVTQFGDSDIFYLDNSGVRSLRARDSSNAAATTDVGTPIDDILTARVAAMSTAEKASVIGLINPTDKRFWLIMGSEIYVYSYYPNSKVNAWTRYEIVHTQGKERQEYRVSEALTFDRRVFLRSGNTILCYGGWGKDIVYDDTPASAWLPMLDANSPTAEKEWRGVDAALKGEWDVAISYDPILPGDTDDVAVLTETTYSLRRIPAKHKSTHIGLRFRSRGGEAVLSAAVVHFEGKDVED